MQEETQKYIEENSAKNNYFQTFKISSRFEKLVAGKMYGGEILNTSSELNKLFEEKISQYKELSGDGVQFPKTLIGLLGTLEYKKLKKEFGERLAIQFNRGHTGQGTVFVSNEDDLKTLQNVYPDREVRIAEFVKGIPYTINACVYMGKVYAGGLSYQITGEKELTNFEGGTVGNDFSFREGFTDGDQDGANSGTYNEIYKQAKLIGEKMALKGYVGLFGIDFILDESGKVIIIEINARQPASIPFHTKLQLEAKQIPLSMLHLMAFLDIRENIDPKDYSLQAMQPINASQVFKRNLTSSPVLVDSEVKTGEYVIQSGMSQTVEGKAYRLQNMEEMRLIYKNYAYNISQIAGNSILLLTQKQGKRVNPGNELMRIQTKQGVVANGGSLKTWIINVFKSITQ